jgi:hypothetical protein
MTGFDWDSVGYSMHYNRSRGQIAWLQNNTAWFNQMKHKIQNKEIATETIPKERILYTFRDEIDLSWWDMMTDENINGGIWKIFHF